MELNNIPDPISEELANVEKLMYQAKFEIALERIEILLNKSQKSSLNHLLGLILKGRILSHIEQYKEALTIGNIVHQQSQKLELDLESIDALILKANVIFLGKTEEAYDYIIEAESIFKSLSTTASVHFKKQQADILLIKSIICRSNGELGEALSLAKQCLDLYEKQGEKIELSRIYWHLGDIYLYKSEPDIALDYAMKSLELQKELLNQNGIAKSLYLVGICYHSKSDFDLALKFCKQSLTIKEISILTKLESLHLLGLIYKEKGELNRTIRYYNRAAILAEKEDYIEEAIINFYGIGSTYRMKGEFDKALEYLKHSLKLSEMVGSKFGIQSSLFYLILLHLDKSIQEKAQNYLLQLEKLANQSESKVFNNVYLIAKALVLKKGNRIRNRTEAELLLKQIIEKGIATPILYRLSVVNLCDLFLEELNITNNVEVLEELIPLINEMFDIAENQNAYSWLAEIKLLQAKLALIQMDFDKSKQLLTQAQRIAEMHDLALLALKISSEHDNFLDHLNEWNVLKKSNAPMSERIKLASFNGVVDRMQGKSVIEPPIIVPEIPVLLLIIGEGGFPLFSNQFEEEYKFEEDLISGFLAAFNTFSGELFSKGLDRVKFGEHMLLMQTVERFSVCYLFKGQTYIARQKLTQFTEKIQNEASIWNTLKNYYNTSRVVKLEEIPLLGSLISEIFTK
ncbi:MAG: tetratricopeptide repeat protein [Candidatus Hermodarchaeota archaeon]